MTGEEINFQSKITQHERKMCEFLEHYVVKKLGLRDYRKSKRMYQNMRNLRERIKT